LGATHLRALQGMGVSVNVSADAAPLIKRFKDYCHTLRPTPDGVYVIEVPLFEFQVVEEGIEVRLKGTIPFFRLYGAIQCGPEILALFEGSQGGKLWAEAVFEVIV
jgi:hypothetical protein